MRLDCGQWALAPPAWSPDPNGVDPIAPVKSIPGGLNAHLPDLGRTDMGGPDLPLRASDANDRFRFQAQDFVVAGHPCRFGLRKVSCPPEISGIPSQADLQSLIE